MQVAKIKRAIGKLWRLDQYNLNSIVGHCDRIYFKTVRAGQMLLFLEAEVGLRSIVVGDHSGQLVSKLKRILDDLLMITWQLRLAS